MNLPRRFQYVVAWDHELCRAVVGVFLRAVLGFLQSRAPQAGVFARDASGGLAFRKAAPLADSDVVTVVDTVRQRILRLLDRRGHGVDDEGFAPDRWAEEAPVLAGMGAASVQGRLLLGPRAGAAVRRLGDVLDAVDDHSAAGHAHARRDGFDLHAGVGCAGRPSPSARSVVPLCARVRRLPRSDCR